MTKAYKAQQSGKTPEGEQGWYMQVMSSQLYDGRTKCKLVLSSINPDGGIQEYYLWKELAPKWVKIHSF